MTVVRPACSMHRASRRPALLRRSLQAALLSAAFLVTGCASDDLDVFGVFEEEPAAPQSASEQGVRERGNAASAAAQDSETPSLNSVPSRPDAGSPTVRQRVVEGLVADRENARYTDEAIRLQGETAAPVRAPAPEPVREQAVTPPPAPEPAPAPATPRAPEMSSTSSMGAPTPSNSRPAAMARADESIDPSPPAASMSGRQGDARVPSQIAATTPPPPPPAAPGPQTYSQTGTQTASRPAPQSQPPQFQQPPSQAQQPASGSVFVDTSALNDGVPSYSQVGGYPGAQPGYTPPQAYAPPQSGYGGAGPQQQVATIQFAHGSASLDARDRNILSAVATAQRQSGGSVLVVGHASSQTGVMDRAEHERANFRMSLDRANAVAQGLIQAGIAPNMVRVEAVSDSAPIYAEVMPTGSAGNRRADIFLLR